MNILQLLQEILGQGQNQLAAYRGTPANSDRFGLKSMISMGGADWQDPFNTILKNMGSNMSVGFENAVRQAAPASGGGSGNGTSMGGASYSRPTTTPAVVDKGFGTGIKNVAGGASYSARK